MKWLQYITEQERVDLEDLGQGAWEVVRGMGWRRKIINLRIVKGKSQKSTELKQKSVKQMQVQMKEDNGD